MDNLAQVSAALAEAPASRFEGLLAKRRTLLDQIDARSGSEDLDAALRSGRGARSRLLVEIGALRAQIDDLRRLRAGLAQLRPAREASRSLDIRL